MRAQAIKIVEEVIGQQMDHLFRQMDRLEEEHGHFTDMPLPQFQQHHRLGLQAARLGLARDRIVRRIEKELVEIPEEAMSELLDTIRDGDIR